jgi:hypothetical protein
MDKPRGPVTSLRRLDQGKTFAAIEHENQREKPNPKGLKSLRVQRGSTTGLRGGYY